jgi:oxygen-dependent protoporphyrinogen oxidase
MALDTSGQIGDKRKVKVIGAGFSGLVSAYYLLKAGFAVEIFEATSRAGGLINSIDCEWGLVETAANGLLNSVEVESLFEDIGARLAPTLKIAKRRYVFRQGRARRWPLSVSASLRILAVVFKFFWDLCNRNRSSVKPEPLESVRAWGNRIMGAEASAYTIETFLQGVYAGDAGRMSASAIFGRFFERHGERRSKARPKIRGTVSAEGGMGEVVDRLRRYLQERGVVFHFDAGQVLDVSVVEPVVVATSAMSASKVLSIVDAERASALERVEMLPLITTTIAYAEPIKPAGFGCLFPPQENRRVLGVLMNSFIFAGRSKRGFSETWIMGGALGESKVPGFLERSDEEILAIIDEERAKCFSAAGQRIGYRMTRWPKALPHYTLQLERDLPLISCNRKNVFLIGNYLGQIGLAKILERAASLPQELASQGQWR